MTGAAVLPDRTAAELVADAAARLREAGAPSPRLDAELLVGHAFGRDRAWLHAHS
jgi:methylase of polypeptide subunit release factors